MEGLAKAAGHEDRQTPLKNYCKGLLLPGERKSIEPMAGRLDPEHIQAMRQSLHHLVAKAPWSDAVLLEEVRNYVLSALLRLADLVIVPVQYPSCRSKDPWWPGSWMTP